jgi:hypothetical protein
MAMKIKPRISSETEPVHSAPATPEENKDLVAGQGDKALTDTTAFLSDLSSLCTASPSSDEFFPVVKLLWAIEAQNNPDKYDLADCGKLLLTSGGSYEVLEPGTRFVVIASRNSIRKLVDTGEGGKDYSRAYAQVGEVESASHATYRANCDNKEWQAGIALLVAVIKMEGPVALAAWEQYKADPSYFFPRLSPATLVQKMSLQIDEPNHMRNLKPNKQGTGSYLDKSKFTKHALVPLANEQVKSIINLVVEKQALFQSWLEK